MSPPALASIDDLERRMGGTIEGEDQRVRAEALLGDASALVRAVAKRTWVDGEGALSTVPDLVVALVCGVALRSMRNPDEIESTQLGAVSVRFRSVWLTKNESDVLAKLASGVQGFVSIDMTHGYGWDTTSPYWAGLIDVGGGNYLPVDYGGEDFGPLVL